ncbi:MAG: transposase [Gemmatimonadales bacterium]
MRLADFHYGGGATYFVTVCTHRRSHVLAKVEAVGAVLTPLGLVIQRQWHAITTRDAAIHLDELVIMPDHLHGILEFGPSTRVRLPRIMAWFKGTSLIASREQGLWDQTALWQRGYYERVIRNQREMDQIRAYIQTNPIRWSLKRGNP